MRVQRILVPLRHFFREITPELAAQIRIVRHRAVEQFVVERKLGIGEQHRELRPCQRHVALAPFRNCQLVGQEFNAAVELAAHFKRLHQALLEAEVLEAAPLRQRERERLLVVVAQNQLRHFVRHLGEKRVACLHREGVRRGRAG